VKILVCGADGIDLYFRFMFLSISFIRFIFFISYGLILLFLWCLFYYKWFGLFYWLEYYYIEW